MSAVHDTRIRRLQRLVALVPGPGTGKERYPDVSRLLAVINKDDGTGERKPVGRRTLELDLKELIEQGTVEVVNPGGKPLRYRRCAEDPAEDPQIWQYTLQQIADLVADAVPRRQLDRLWERLLGANAEPLLDASRLRIVPDTLRLQAAALSPRVLLAVITALASGYALEVRYRNAQGERSTARLHPQALVQRGPLSYLLALKNDEEEEPVRFYALHRMLAATALCDVPARAASHFDLDAVIRDGRVDFGQGESIDLELRVRGYLTEVLIACPLEPKQQWEDAPEDSAFDILVRATVPSTGQLLRWLLGAGDNVEVVAPAALRHTVAVQAAKMVGLYGAGAGADGSGVAD